MKSLINRIALFAAGAVVLGTMAFGQSRIMTAKIPFAFRTANGVLPAGEYAVLEPMRNSSVTTLRNTVSHKTVSVIGMPADYGKAGDAEIGFRCGSSDCSLAWIRTSDRKVSYGSGKAPKDELAVVTVPIRISNGD